MQAFDVFLFPSIYEGLPVVLIEAQSAGLKCIISDTIPTEADVTDLIIRCCLNSPIEKWCEIILNHTNYERRRHDEDLRAAGYAIEQTTMELTDIYFKAVNTLCKH